MDKKDISATKTAEVIQVRADQLAEMAEKQAGTTAIQKIVQKHLTQIETIRAQFPLDNIDLITTNISSKRGIIGAVSDEIGRLHEKIKIILEAVASGIENRKYKTAEEAVQDMELGFNERQQATELMEADKTRLISCQSLNVTMEIFAKLNKLIEQQIEESKTLGDPKKEGNLLL